MQIRSLSPFVKHFVLSAPDGFSFEAGQFVSAMVHNGEKLVRRSYSVASSTAANGTFELCIRKVENGFVSTWFDGREVGDFVDFMGPLGHFKIKDDSKHLVFIAVGSGISPLRSMILSLLDSGHTGKITLLTGFRHEDHMLYGQEWAQLAEKHEHFSWQTVISQPSAEWSGATGRVQQLVEKELLHLKSAHFYLCGLKDMILETVDLLKSNGIAKEQIFYERYN